MTTREITLAIRSLESDYFSNKKEIVRLLNLANCDTEILVDYAFPFVDLVRGPTISIRRGIRKSKKITYSMIFDYLAMFYDDFDAKTQKNSHILSASGSIEEFQHFFFNPNFSSAIFADLLALDLSEAAREHLLRWALKYPKSEVWVLEEALAYSELRWSISSHPSISEEIVSQVYNDAKVATETSPNNDPLDPYRAYRLQNDFELITLALIRNPSTSVEFLKSLIPTSRILPKNKDFIKRFLRALIRALPDDEDREQVVAMLSSLPKSAFSRKNNELVAHTSKDPETLAAFIYGSDEKIRDIAALNPHANEADQVFVILTLGDKPKQRLKVRF